MFLIVEVFDYVRLLNCSITELSIAFDWQNFFVSSIKFEYRTQSNPIERLGSITERSIDYVGIIFRLKLTDLLNRLLVTKNV